MKFGKAFQEFIYSLSTNDKYAEFDSRKSFNRLHKPLSEHETNLLAQSNLSSASVNDIEEHAASTESVHEVNLAWRHIKNWLYKHSPDLNSSLQKPCTDSDLEDFQKDLNIHLPRCVIEFFKQTDGQLTDDYNNIGGLIFGLKLMSLDEISVMTENWRKVVKTLESELFRQTTRLQTLPKMSNFRSSSSLDLIETVSSPVSYSDAESSASTLNVASVEPSKASKIPMQKCIPPGKIHCVFAHPMWIPLITDEAGNCIGLDLSPPSSGSGKWGQVILFGREFDTKFLLADNFGDFLLIFANDLEMGNWKINTPDKNNYGDLMIGNEGDLVFVEKSSGEEINYLTVLKKRCIEKWIHSLDNQELDENTRDLIKDLKANPDSILNVRGLNDKSIDSFINDNLNFLDKVNAHQLRPKAAGNVPNGSSDPVDDESNSTLEDIAF